MKVRVVLCIFVCFALLMSSLLSLHFELCLRFHESLFRYANPVLSTISDKS